MGAYAIDWQRTVDTSKTVGSVSADATRPRRGKLFEMNLSSEAPPADNPFRWQLQRFTAAGTSTAVVPQPLDPADATTEMDAGENHTVEPTYVSAQIMFDLGLNQRATFRWVAAPGKEIVFPATASNGLGMLTPVGSAVVVTVQNYIEEQ